MAKVLLRTGFADGAMIHTYHAFECAISAVIAVHGESVPPNHHHRLSLWSRIRDVSKPYAAMEERLPDLTMSVRNNALYYDEADGLLPHDRFSSAFVGEQLRLVAGFVFQLRHELR